MRVIAQVREVKFTTRPGGEEEVHSEVEARRATEVEGVQVEEDQK